MSEEKQQEPFITPEWMEVSAQRIADELCGGSEAAEEHIVALLAAEYLDAQRTAAPVAGVEILSELDRLSVVDWNIFARTARYIRALTPSLIEPLKQEAPQPPAGTPNAKLRESVLKAVHRSMNVQDARDVVIKGDVLKAIETAFNTAEQQ